MSRKTLIKEFSLQTASNFVSPLRREEASKFLGRLLESLGQYVDARNTRFLSKDLAFDYQLTVTLLAGAAHVVFEPHLVTSTLLKGFNRPNLEFVSECFIKIFEAAMPNPVINTTITFSAHCTFSSQADYSEFMEPFISKKLGIDSGGRLVSGVGRNFDGSLRIFTEKSASFEDALFVIETFVTKEPVKADLFARMITRSVELLDTLGLTVDFEDPVKPQA
jgi:hypothetical protein